MKSRPILFSTPMVEAILAGRKSMTRRALKLPSWSTKDWDDLNVDGDYVGIICDESGCEAEIDCPYGKVGDVLWIRETYCYLDDKDCEGRTSRVYYKADHLEINDDWFKENYKWRPSIFMPKAVARIFLKITNIRVERLNSITKSDAIAEGVEVIDNIISVDKLAYKDYRSKKKNDEIGWSDPTISFFGLWDRINGITYDNPWVWVVEFERVTGKEVGDE